MASKSAPFRTEAEAYIQHTQDQWSGRTPPESPKGRCSQWGDLLAPWLWHLRTESGRTGKAAEIRNGPAQQETDSHNYNDKLAAQSDACLLSSSTGLTPELGVRRGLQLQAAINGTCSQIVRGTGLHRQALLPSPEDPATALGLMADRSRLESILHAHAHPRKDAHSQASTRLHTTLHASSQPSSV